MKHLSCNNWHSCYDADEEPRFKSGFHRVEFKAAKQLMFATFDYIECRPKVKSFSNILITSIISGQLTKYRDNTVYNHGTHEILNNMCNSVTHSTHLRINPVSSDASSGLGCGGSRLA